MTGNRNYGYPLLVCVIIFALASCIFSADEDRQICPPGVAMSAATTPIAHPSANTIGYNYTPVNRIVFPNGSGCPGRIVFDRDSAGFWLVDPDGSGSRRAFPNVLRSPAWNPDGSWIAFELGAQIYKMQFVGNGFDEGTLVQMSSEGRNFFPSWSPDGEWIAYDNTSCGSSGSSFSCGIFLVKNDGSGRSFLAAGRMPTWNPDGTEIFFIGLQKEIYRVSVLDPNDVVRITSLNQSNPYATHNYSPRVSPDGTMIAFASQPGNGRPDVCLMRVDGTSLRKITSEGTLEWVSWIGNDELIYVSHRSDDWSYENGTIWRINIHSGVSVQLTSNE